MEMAGVYTGVTWAYSEKYDWFGLGMHATGKQPVPQAWLDATAAAKKAGQSPGAGAV